MNEIISYFLNGGPLMWVILVLSIVSWAIVIERAIRLKRERLIDDDVVRDVREALRTGDLAAAEQASKSKGVLVGLVLERGLDEFRFTEADFETSLQNAAERELQVLWNNMGALTTVARVATMVGLLGTVVGMVLGFKELSSAGIAKEQLAAAIGIALTTTVGGLLVAIPAITCESWLQFKIRKLMTSFEEVLLSMVKAASMGNITKSQAKKSLQKESKKTSVAPPKVTAQVAELVANG